MENTGSLSRRSSFYYGAGGENKPLEYPQGHEGSELL